MIRTIVWLVYLAGYLIVMLPTARRAQRLRKNGQEEQAKEIINSAVQKWAVRILKAASAEVEVKGTENIPDEPAVYIANHQSDFDIPLMLGYVGEPRALMAKIELKKVPGVHLWMTLLNCIFLDRSDMKASVKALMDGARMVKAGESITVFPEGTRSKGGAPHEFKGGAFRIATRSKAPIVPVTIDGSYHLFEERMRIHPGKVTVTIHPPVQTKGLTKEEQNELPQRIEKLVLGAIEEK